MIIEISLFLNGLSQPMNCIFNVPNDIINVHFEVCRLGLSTLGQSK